MNIAGKKISIIGAVRSGIGAGKLAKRLGAVPFVSDSSTKEKLQKSIAIFESEEIDYEYGGHTEKVFVCDLIVTSPGVPSDSEILTEALKRKIKIVSEVEFASWYCKGKIISITGTNGKTTTTALMAHTLNECGLKTYSAGNIGDAFSEIVLDVNENEFVVLETSSFQLDFTEKFKPMFALILNITPDHLDRYENNFNKYIVSKFKITSNQNEKDFFIYNADDKNTYEALKNNRVSKLCFSLKEKVENGTFLSDNKLIYSLFGNEQQVCLVSDLFIKGEHNVANALSVLAVAKSLNLSNEKISEAFSSFKGVEHRIEFVRAINGIEFYNDSKATNVDSVWYALKSFTKPIYLILGGKDKGNDYGKIKDLVKDRVRKIYAIGSSAQKVFDYFEKVVPTEIKKSLDECVQSSLTDAMPGDVVLLSPACASFDMFENYEHRGKIFKEIVNKAAV